MRKAGSNDLLGIRGSVSRAHYVAVGSLLELTQQVNPMLLHCEIGQIRHECKLCVRSEREIGRTYHTSCMDSACLGTTGNAKDNREAATWQKAKGKGLTDSVQSPDRRLHQFRCSPSHYWARLLPIAAKRSKTLCDLLNSESIQAYNEVASRG